MSFLSKIFKKDDVKKDDDILLKKYCPNCNTELVDWCINLREPKTPDIIGAKFIFGLRCNKCTYRNMLAPIAVFAVIQVIYSNKNDENFERNLRNFEDVFDEAIEIALRRDLDIPNEVWKIYTDIIREDLYAKYDAELGEYNHMRRDMHVIYYFDDYGRLIWGLD